MNLIKLEDLNIVSLEEIRRKLNKKYDKMVFNDKINKTGEKLNVDKIESNPVNNIILKPEEFCEPSRDTHFMRPRYIPVGHTTSFSSVFIPRKTTNFEEINLNLISQI